MGTHGGSQSQLRSHASILLLPEENQKLFKDLIGCRCQSLATAVVRVYTAMSLQGSEVSDVVQNCPWQKACCGMACFIKDHAIRSYFIRVYDIIAQRMVFEEELYTQFRYRAPCPSFFHTFEGQFCQVGLSFADESEAHYFRQTIDAKIIERRRRREERNAQRRISSSSHLPDRSSREVRTSTISVDSKSRNQQSAVSRRKIRKEDISAPSNFKHVSHVGVDKPTCDNQTTNQDSKDAKISLLLTSAGISTANLNDAKTKNFIYDFIDNHGGVNAIVESQRRTQSTANRLSAHQVSTAEKRRQFFEDTKTMLSIGQSENSLDAISDPGCSLDAPSAAPPVPPPRISSIEPGRVDSYHVPLPPLPDTSSSSSDDAATSLCSRQHSLSSLPPDYPAPERRSDVPAIPPPPPPPLPPTSSCIAANSPKSAEVRESDSPAVNHRSALMEEIKAGRQLHSVSEDKPAARPNARDSMLMQIRSGQFQLKKVDRHDSHGGRNRSSFAGDSLADDFATLLSQALMDRNRALHSPSSSEAGSAVGDSSSDSFDD